jgi:hypothetical protein
MQKNGVIRSKKVAEVMETIDRALFIPDRPLFMPHGIKPYSSRPVMIEVDLIIPGPNMHCACLQLLEEHLQPGMCALDVGSGVILTPSITFYTNIQALLPDNVSILIPMFTSQQEYSHCNIRVLWDFLKLDGQVIIYLGYLHFVLCRRSLLLS